MEAKLWKLEKISKTLAKSKKSSKVLWQETVSRILCQPSPFPAQVQKSADWLVAMGPGDHAAMATKNYAMMS